MLAIMAYQYKIISAFYWYLVLERANNCAVHILQNFFPNNTDFFVLDIS
jgi:hypothetical protein